ncbi:Rossmann-like and DUF2520 domain-containing protein [Gracilimonas sp. Q87]|uniref:Rossmann-like and DUF2520 domain-containing protein n=1 Tax=Gracilimonas sp. Q87 TaxID=3384766 RepID=UPI0039845CA1
MDKPSISISIIGLGKVGTALLRVLSENGYRILSTIDRGSVSKDLRSEYSEVTLLDSIPDSKEDLGNLILITVPDDAIAEIVNDLDKKFKSLNHISIAHCSGTHSSATLGKLRSKGAKIASFHPIRSITGSTKDFKDTWFDVEGDLALIKVFERIAEDLDANLIEIEASQKPYLHTSAVIASNYLVVLANLMTKVSVGGDIPEEVSLKAMIPLMRNTLDNIEQNGVSDSLTGPIARGDVNTVKDHLKLLSSHPDLFRSYKLLGLEALKMSTLESSKGPAYDKLMELLS